MRHLKKDVLRLLADRQCRDARSIAEGVRYAEPRSMSSYLRRLEGQRLIQSSYLGRAVGFRITAKGIARLRFFMEHPSYDFMRRKMKAR